MKDFVKDVVKDVVKELVKDVPNPANPVNPRHRVHAVHAIHIAAVENFLDRRFPIDQALAPGRDRLVRSIRYSLLQKGGKRFRPTLSCLTAEALAHDFQKVVPFAGAVECIHTYSLIHDDLPAMDNDDFRRGEPTNHKAFDEATAILAGDALLTEAFAILADAYTSEPDLAVAVTRELSRASGEQGMVGGQAIDLAAKGTNFGFDELKALHRLKTGALIRVSARGAALLCRATGDQVEQVTAFAEDLGLAFQVADDLLDFNPEKPESGSYASLLGVKETRSQLLELTDSALANLASWSSKADLLRAIATFNRDRTM